MIATQWENTHHLGDLGDQRHHSTESHKRRDLKDQMVGTSLMVITQDRRRQDAKSNQEAPEYKLHYITYVTLNQMGIFQQTQ